MMMFVIMFEVLKCAIDEVGFGIQKKKFNFVPFRHVTRTEVAGTSVQVVRASIISE
jgi:hypothetical protein